MRTSDVLRRRFGLSDLYPVQRSVISRVLAGGHALVVLPTGAGKSLCYQLPALTLAEEGRGTTVVFSPLIALMEDQVAALRQRGVRAAYINSTLRREARESRYRALARGEYEIVYVTPERMHKPEFLEAIRRVPGSVPLLAIDEAHCITKWGHDFRPAYQEVGRFRETLGSPVTLALTATATREVRDDIRATLGMDRESLPLFSAGIDRPNLTFSTREVWSPDDRVRELVDIASRAGGTSMAYFTLIKMIDDLEGAIRRAWPGRVEIYHGKLDPAEKKRVYDRFTQARPRDRLLLLATNAFGMGVDKPDIRSIVHVQLPGSVEAWYQEVGRAGRDGEPSECTLLYSEDDLAIQQDFIEWMNPSPDVLARASDVFARHAQSEVALDDVRRDIVGRDRGDRRLEYAAITLEKLGVIEPATLPETYRFVRALDAAEIDPEAMAEKRARDLRRLLSVLELSRAEDMRSFVLEYFELGASASDGAAEG